MTDGEQRSALAVVRSLGRAGHRVHVASATRRSLAGASRATHARLVVPPALTDTTAFTDAIASYAKAHEIAAVIPATEASALALLAAPDRLPTIPMADLTAFRALSDKAALYDHAAAADLAFPPQCVARDRDEALRAEVRYPIVLKPSRSVNDGVKLSVVHVANRAELESRLHRLPPAAYPLLMQQRIIGPGVGVFILMWEGEPVASFMHRRIREKPPSGGVSVYAESIAPDANLIDRAVRLLKAFGWRGVAMVELKVDARTGTPYVMEINGRFWGSLQLAIDAGVDFPAILVDRVLGGTARGPATWRTGVRGRWWWGDVDYLVARLRRSDAALALPPDAPRRGRAMIDFVTTIAPDQVFRFTDPMPFVRESLQWLTRSA